MYRLTVDGDETYMIVTRNVFSHRLSVYKKYDLKVKEDDGSANDVLTVLTQRVLKGRGGIKAGRFYWRHFFCLDDYGEVNLTLMTVTETCL